MHGMDGMDHKELGCHRSNDQSNKAHPVGGCALNDDGWW